MKIISVILDHTLLSVYFGNFLILFRNKSKYNLLLVFMTCLAHSRNSIQNLLNRIILHFFWVLSNWDKSPMANKQEFLFFFKFYFIFKLYNIVLVLPNIEMNPPQVYLCSPSWIPMYPAFLPSFSTCRKKRKKERKLIAQSCPTLCNPMDCSLPGSFLYPWNSLGKSTGVGCYFFL